MQRPDLERLRPKSEDDPGARRVFREFAGKIKELGKTFPGAEGARACWKCFRDRTESWERRAIACAALLYLILVVDVIPDPLPGGLLDDIVVISLTVAALNLSDSFERGD